LTNFHSASGTLACTIHSTRLTNQPTIVVCFDLDLHNFKYFIGVVPTIYVDRINNVFESIIVTNQYAVTEFGHRFEDDQAMPGIFFDYEIDPISVRITADRIGFVSFFTKLCATVGGVFVVAGGLLRMYYFLVRK
jgi:hypothetical protein